MIYEWQSRQFELWCIARSRDIFVLQQVRSLQLFYLIITLSWLDIENGMHIQWVKFYHCTLWTSIVISSNKIAFKKHSVIATLSQLAPFCPLYLIGRKFLLRQYINMNPDICRTYSRLKQRFINLPVLFHTSIGIVHCVTREPVSALLTFREWTNIVFMEMFRSHWSVIRSKL